MTGLNGINGPARRRAELLLSAAILTGLAARLPAAEAPAAADDVMRPTERGLRLTPSMARGMMRNMMQDGVWRDIALSPDQESRLADAMSRRVMQVAHANGKELQPLVEFFFETMLANNGKIPREASKEFADRTSPLIRTARDVLSGMAEDARPVLTPEQNAKLDAEMQRQLKAIDKLEQRMNAWSNGEYKDGERPFDDLDHEIQSPPPASETTQAPASKELENARRQANNELRWGGAGEWQRFLAACRTFFGFTKEQSARGEQILADYRRRAKEITTPEWTRQIRMNRIRYNMRSSLGNLPSGPWAWHLDNEYNEAMRPLRELGRGFRQELLSLATPEQRTLGIESLRKLASTHALALDSEIEGMLFPTTTQSQGAP